MYSSRSSSIGVSYDLRHGETAFGEALEIDVAVGPVPSDGPGTGAVGSGDAFAVGDNTLAVAIADVAVEGGSVDASVGTFAAAEGAADEFVYAATVAELDAWGGGQSGVWMSYSHSGYATDGIVAEATSTSTTSLVTVDPWSQSADIDLDPFDTADLDVAGLEGSAAIYDIDVFARGENSFANLDLSAFSLEDFSTVSFLAVAEIA